ncbi:hypothetical protein [Streptomyces mangrovi]|uniref:hypothetical protein n=1 Tax=Streptomyces mangrovi TaxID=1206892 RepID=UPI00399C99A6
MSARRRAPRAPRSLRLPEPDGIVAGVVLAAANVLGIGAAAGSAGIVPTVPGALPVTVLDDDAPVSGRGTLPAASGMERR